MHIRKMKLTVLLAGLALTLAASAHAANLVTNGSFESLTSGTGQLGYNTNATDWTTNGYNFVFGPGEADNSGVTGQYGNLQLWGPNNGSANGLPATSPDGGNFVAADGAYGVAPISQTINGLTAGHNYTVSFWWAGAQQFGFTGATTENWTVSLGGQSFTTATVNNVNHGFTGWQKQSFTYTATSSSEVLSFLAYGTPSGVPPFSVLDGVSLNAATPEPGSLILLASGVLGSVGSLRMKKFLRR